MEIRGKTNPRTSQRAQAASRSERAVEIMLAERVTLQVAADRVGVSRQAAHQAWRKICGTEPTPFDQAHEQAREQALARIRSLAAAGATTEATVQALHVRRARVQELAHEAGAILRSERDQLLDQMRLRLGSAVDRVRTGATIGEASRIHMVSYGTLRSACHKLGVAPMRAGWGAVIDGRAVRAAELVRDGLSMSEAAQQEGCAPWSVARHLTPAELQRRSRTPAEKRHVRTRGARKKPRAGRIS